MRGRGNVLPAEVKLTRCLTQFFSKILVNWPTKCWNVGRSLGFRDQQLFIISYLEIGIEAQLSSLCRKCKPSANCACAVSLNDGLGLYSWYPASSSRRVWHGLATVVDSMRESIHAFRCDFLCLQDTQSERTRWRYAFANLHIGLFTCFSRHNF